jgi:hypothetical protein
MCWQSHEQFVSLSTSTHTHTHTHTHTQGSRYASTCPTKAHVSSSSAATVAPRREAQRARVCLHVLAAQERHCTAGTTTARRAQPPAAAAPRGGRAPA